MRAMTAREEWARGRKRVDRTRRSGLAIALAFALADRAVAQGAAPEPERVVLEIGESSPFLEGRGHFVEVERAFELAGTLYVWAESEEVDTYLIVRGDGGEPLAQDDNSGGGRTPFCELELQGPRRVRICIFSAMPGVACHVKLHIGIAAPPQGTTGVVADLEGAMQDWTARLPLADSGASRQELAALVEELSQVEGAASSAVLSRLAWDAAVGARRLGDRRTALAATRFVIAHRERFLPPTHPDLCRAQYNLAATLLELGEVQEASERLEALTATHERVPPADPTDALRAQQGLAMCLVRMGELAAATVRLEALLDRFESELGPGHPELVGSRLNLAAALAMAGELESARRAVEQALASGALQASNPAGLYAKALLGAILGKLGDHEGARRALEEVYAQQIRTLPAEHPAVLATRLNLAAVRERTGDFEASREMLEPVIAAYAESHPPDHPELLRARGNLAIILLELGETEAALGIQKQICATLESSLPENHPDRLQAKLELAQVLQALDRVDEALELEEEVVAAMGSTLPADHPDHLRARGHLAALLERAGDLERATELRRVSLEGLERIHEPGHPHVLGARQDLAVAWLRQGEPERARALIASQLSGLRARLSANLGVPPREACIVASTERHHLSGLIFLASALGEDCVPTRELFELIELGRQVATSWVDASGSPGDVPELAARREDGSRARRQLAERVRGGPGADESVEEWRRDVVKLALARDSIQAELAEALRAHGGGLSPVSVARLAAELGPGLAAAGYLCYKRYDFDQDSRTLSTGVDEVLAGVLRHDGIAVLVDLGRRADLEERVHAWRNSIGRPLQRGVSVGDPAEGLEQRTGKALRRAILDPVLEAAGLGDGEGTLRVCVDDFLNLVPLDALPLDGGGRVGDRLTIRLSASLADAATPSVSRGGRPSMLLLGDVDFDWDPREPGGALASGPSPELALALRASGAGPWKRLLGTKGEVEALSVLFEERYGVGPAVLTRERATKAELVRAVAGCAYVHLATHGWFAPESVPSIADSVRDEAAAQRLDTNLRGFAPLSLCGLCLAGANQGPDAGGWLDGMLTGEELSSLDLSHCELAVLSACETNVGIHRAWQGIHSLQSALHAAGAGVAVTSLWRVPDDQTRELMIELYTNLWDRGMEPGPALWAAKRRLREEGYPVSSWAAWVLTYRSG
jgi:CHAT domain-containing protein/tetratricopeptide (TPR) repeat protein